MTIHTTTIDDMDVEVEFTGTPYRPARISGPPELCYPAEDEEIEITAVHLIGQGFTSTNGWCWNKAQHVQMNVFNLLSVDQLDALEEEIRAIDWQAEEAA